MKFNVGDKVKITFGCSSLSQHICTILGHDGQDHYWIGTEALREKQPCWSYFPDKNTDFSRYPEESLVLVTRKTPQNLFAFAEEQ